ncbi:hypothetical protein ABZP36_025630 [Zizania latifolia]
MEKETGGVGAKEKGWGSGGADQAGAVPVPEQVVLLFYHAMAADSGSPRDGKSPPRGTDGGKRTGLTFDRGK